MKTLGGLGYLCYESYLERGRLPQEIDGADVCAWIRICAWRAARRQETKTRKTRRYIDQVLV